MVTLCGASAYQQKFYLNPDFAKLPESVKQELKIICVGFTEDAGGVFTIDFDDQGIPKFSVRTADYDPNFDEIAAELYIRKMQTEKAELMKQLELFYRIFILGEEPV